MRETDRVLAAMLDLGRFTYAELSAIARVKPPSVRTVVSRYRSYILELGPIPTGRRGGQQKLFELGSEGIGEIQRRLFKDTLAVQLHSESEPASLSLAEDILYRQSLEGVSLPVAERRELYQLFDSSLLDAQRDVADADAGATHSVLRLRLEAARSFKALLRREAELPEARGETAEALLRDSQSVIFPMLRQTCREVSDLVLERITGSWALDSHSPVDFVPLTFGVFIVDGIEHDPDWLTTTLKDRLGRFGPPRQPASLEWASECLATSSTRRNAFETMITGYSPSMEERANWSRVDSHKLFFTIDPTAGKADLADVTGVVDAVSPYCDVYVVAPEFDDGIAASVVASGAHFVQSSTQATLDNVLPGLLSFAPPVIQ